MLPNSSNNKDEVLKKLVLFYYQGFLSFTLKLEEIADLTWNLQQSFVEATILNPLLLKYPLNKNFSRLYIKKLISYLEPHQEVHDKLYEKLCILMDDKSKEDSFHYRHYVISNDLNNIISLRETNNMVVNGTTGMRTWEAGVMLADWALCNRDLFTNRKVLEVGSGVGFTGITISKLCKVKEYIFTDCHNEVLNTLKHNINMNFPYTHTEEKMGMITFECNSCEIGVMSLDWNSTEDFPNLVPDIIIGADVVYDPSAIESLCNVIKTFLSKNTKLEIYLATIIRIEETFQQFLIALDEGGLRYEILQHKDNIYLTWDTNIKRCLFKIY